MTFIKGRVSGEITSDIRTYRQGKPEVAPQTTQEEVRTDFRINDVAGRPISISSGW